MKKIYLLLVAGLFTISVTAQTRTKAKTATKAKPATSKTLEVKSVDKIKVAQPEAVQAVKPMPVDEHAGHNHAVGAHNDLATKPAVAGEDNLGMKETSHDFGKIAQGKPVTYDFLITNTGKESLKLESVVAGCGCTTPEWQPGPYKPGEAAKIKVGFNAGAVGVFSKTVTITYNGSFSKVITISGEVLAAPSTPAPENKGVGMLKGN